MELQWKKKKKKSSKSINQGSIYSTHPGQDDWRCMCSVYSILYVAFWKLDLWDPFLLWWGRVIFQTYWIYAICVCVCLFAKEEIGCILQLSNLGKGYLWIWNRWIVFIRRQNILWQNCCFFRGLWLYGARLCLQPVICYWPPFFQQST